MPFVLCFCLVGAVFVRVSTFPINQQANSEIGKQPYKLVNWSTREQREELFFMQTRCVQLSCQIIIRYVNYRVSASWRDRYSFFI